MQSLKKPLSVSGWLSKSPRILIILGFVFIYLVSCATFAPRASAATLSMPGGRVSDPVVRQVDIARPAVVRIITTINGSLIVHFNSTATATFPQGGGNYPIELSGSGAFISAHGDILTADHVVNPPHDQSLDDALYQEASQDIADYINAHFQVSQPFSAADVVAELETGAFPSTPAYQTPTSEVYLSTAFSGPVNALRFADIPASDRATVDRIEVQSSFDAMDIAVIHVSGMDNMPSIQLGDSSQVAEQDNLTIIGYPGLGDVSNSPTDLLTSSINKIYVSALKTTDSGAPVIQVGGNVEHGDSGAPALDDNGNIVGIVSFGIFDPNETGETSFLQASNSARTLIQQQGIDTTPGSFERAWSQAFDDYASPAAGHWHKAAQELQSLVNNHQGFVGVTDYLTYAQSQASHEQLPTSTSSGPELVLIAVLVLLILVVIGAILFVVTRRRTRPALAGASQFTTAPFGGYPPQPGAVSRVYPPTPGSYSAPTYPQMSNGVSGVYPPASSSSPTYPQPVAGSYPLDPASYAAATWSEQPGNQLPQTPLPAVSETPLPALSSQAATISEEQAVPFIAPVQTPQPLESDAATLSPHHEHALPTWAPPAQTPEPVLSAQSASQEEALPGGNGELPFARPFLPSGDSWPTVTVGEEDGKAAAAPARTFSVPRRPSNPLASGQEIVPAESSSGVHTLVAPCGHTNASNVRFCRVCGQPITPTNVQDSTDSNAL